ncbi:MAG: hypothetical protein JO085_04045, partial [Acidimicrobiia bacterium]|nr:hypothetical protein [Acidimicrobiia bacterium]
MRDGTPRAEALGARAVGIIQEMRSFLADLDPETCTGGQAVELFKRISEMCHLGSTAKSRVAPRIEATGVWKESQEPSCASFLASLEGGSRGQARSTLEVGKALAEFPLLEERARQGSLSHPKLVELATTLASEPDAERTLMSGAETEPLWATKERCQRVRATSTRRHPLAATKRIRAGRHFTWWSDAEGAFCFQGRDTADRGALIRDRIDQLAKDIRRERSSSGGIGEHPRETDGALRADAFFALIGRVPGGSAESPTPRHPRSGRHAPTKPPP